MSVLNTKTFADENIFAIDIDKNSNGTSKYSSHANGYNNRQQWLLANRIPQLLVKLKTYENLYWDSNFALHTFSAADPSKNKNATQWLIDSYLQEGFLHEDILDGKNSKAYQTLKWFEQHKNKLDKSQRNLCDYSSLSEIYQSIVDFVNEELEPDRNLSSKEIKQANKIRAEKESYVVFDEKDFKVVIPRTEFASQWWGQGTRWCTASVRTRNFFDLYNKSSPLFIVCFEQTINSDEQKNKKTRFRKFQLWVDSTRFEFMDETDGPVDNEIVYENWNIFGKLIKLCLSKNGSALRYVPEHLRTQRVCENAVKQNGRALKWVPERFQTNKMYLLAVKSFDQALNLIPKDKINFEICNFAITQSPWCLPHVPKEFLTEKLCLKAVKSFGYTLEHVPEHMRTNKVCQVAVNTSSSAIRFVPENVKVKINISSINLLSLTSFYRIPEYHMNAQICQQIIKLKPSQLEFIPEKFKTKQLCEQAVKKYPRALKYVPDCFITEKMCFEAIKQNSTVWEDIPCQFKKGKTEEIYKILTSPWLLKEQPNTSLNNKLCYTIIKNDGMMLKHIPLNFVNKSLCEQAIQSNALALKYVPEKYQTKGLYLNAIRINWESFEYVPYSLRDYSLCAKAYLIDKRILKFVPEKFLENGKFRKTFKQKYFGWFFKKDKIVNNTDWKITHIRKQLDKIEV